MTKLIDDVTMDSVFRIAEKRRLNQKFRVMIKSAHTSPWFECGPRRYDRIEDAEDAIKTRIKFIGSYHYALGIERHEESGWKMVKEIKNGNYQ